jgi:hypothetical protein
MTKQQPDAQTASQELMDETLDQAIGGTLDLGVWQQNYGSTIPATSGTGVGPHVKVFDGRGG